MSRPATGATRFDKAPNVLRDRRTVSVILDPPPIGVAVDIRPRSDTNTIKCTKEREQIGVAILTSEDFDATTVDHTTVRFEGAREIHLDKKSGNPNHHEKDVNRDGDTDLLFHFKLGDTSLTCDSTDATLVGETFDGQAIVGVDSSRMIGG